MVLVIMNSYYGQLGRADDAPLPCRPVAPAGRFTDLAGFEACVSEASALFGREAR